MRTIALHGFTGEGADFAELRTHLPATTELVAPDLPGHGARRGLRQAEDYALGLITAEERAERQLADAALATFLRTQGLAAFYKYWHHQPMLRTFFQGDSPARDVLVARRAANAPEALALSLETVGTGSLPSLWDRLGELRGAVDLVTGEADPKFTELARRMGEKIPRARLSVVEGAGHAVHLEKSGDLATLMGF